MNNIKSLLILISLAFLINGCKDEIKECQERVKCDGGNVNLNCECECPSDNTKLGNKCNAPSKNEFWIQEGPDCFETVGFGIDVENLKVAINNKDNNFDFSRYCRDVLRLSSLDLYEDYSDEYGKVYVLHSNYNLFEDDLRNTGIFTKCYDFHDYTDYDLDIVFRESDNFTKADVFFHFWKDVSANPNVRYREYGELVKTVFKSNTAARK